MMVSGLLTFRLKMGLAVLSMVLLGLALAVAVASYAFGIQVGPSLVTAMLVFLFALSVFQWLFGPYLINLMYNAIEVKPYDPQYGWLVQVVHEVALRNGVSPPKVYIADVPFPNAFAYGSPIAGKRVAVTLPTLRILTREELRAVLGHEIGHLRHHDVEVLMAVGLIPSLIYYLGWSLLWGGGNSRNGYGPLVGIALIALSFVFNLFVLYINRLREAYADINSALTVEDGASNLQLALAKIVLATNPNALQAYRKKANMAMLFFNDTAVNVYSSDAQQLVEVWKRTKVSPLDELFSTHPHPAKRIQMLEKLKY